MFKQIAPPKEKLVERTRYHAREATIVGRPFWPPIKTTVAKIAALQFSVIDERARGTYRCFDPFLSQRWGPMFRRIDFKRRFAHDVPRNLSDASKEIIVLRSVR